MTFPITYAGARMWADPSGVEPSALEQIRNTMSLPWTHGLAVMPDVHTGFGVTIGSVIAMKGAVSPSAVGVDLGCVGGESEYLGADAKWRKMSRRKARNIFTEADLAAQTEGIECRKGSGVLDEAPGAYKDIDEVMKAQKGLVRTVARLQTLLCVKG